MLLSGLSETLYDGIDKNNCKSQVALSFYPEFIQSKNQGTLLLTLVMFNRSERRINHLQKYEFARRANTGAWQREKSKASNSKRGRGLLSNQLPRILMAPLRRSRARCNHTTSRKHPFLSSCFLHLCDFFA